MDPWLNSNISDSSNIVGEGLDCFEDNFRPTINNTLPDSAQYLATLESKLSKLKSDPDVLKQLTDRHESCMQQLLTTGADLNSDETAHLETAIADSTLLRTLQPQKQALTLGELAELVNFDQLQRNTDEDTDDNTSR